MAVVAAAGVDTWSPCWRLHQDSDAAAAADELATVPTRRGRLLAQDVEGHRVMWFADAGLLAAEGHPAGPGRLASPDELPEAYARLTASLEACLGSELPTEGQRFRFSEHGFAGVRRLDTAVNLRWDDGSREGLGLLSGLAAMTPPGRLQSVIRRQPGGRATETVSWQGTRGIVARAYDKGVEGGLAPRGQLVRLEDQRRWASGQRRDVEELTADVVRETWRRRFAPLWQATKGLKIVTREQMARELKSAMDEGRISAGEAIDVAGHLVMEAAGVKIGARNTRWRHAKKARELGLVLDESESPMVLRETVIDVHAIMEAAFDDAAWRPQG